MEVEELKLCWADLGEGKVCELVADHDGEHSPDARDDFPNEAIARQSRAMEQGFRTSRWGSSGN